MPIFGRCGNKACNMHKMTWAGKEYMLLLTSHFKITSEVT